MKQDAGRGRIGWAARRMVATMACCVASLVGVAALSLSTPLWAAGGGTSNGVRAHDGAEAAKGAAASTSGAGRVGNVANAGNGANVGSGTSAGAAAETTVNAPVRYANRTVLHFRTAYLGVPPAERARRAMDNIDQALSQGGPGEVTSEMTPQGALILIDGTMVISLQPADADALSGETLDDLTASTVQALRVSVQETQEARNTHGLLISAGLVVAATGVAVGLYLGLSRLRRVTLDFLFRSVRTYSHRLGSGASEVLRAGRIKGAIEWLDLGLRWGVGLLLAYTWLSYSLQRFPYTRPWGEGLHQYLLDVVIKLLKGITGAVPGLVVAALILLLARGAVGIVRSFFNRVELGMLGVGWMSRDAAGPTRRVATWGIWLFALAMAYPYLPGAETEAFRGMSVLVGLMLSVGASSFVGQVAGGLILTYSNMLRKGEYVRIGEHEGTVVQVGAFNTRIRTGLGEEISLPNALITSTPTRNFSREVEGPGFIVDTSVTIGYDTPWRQVEAMLIEAAHRTRCVLGEPVPVVYQTSLSDFYPAYRLVCHAVPERGHSRASILSVLHAHIQDVFNEHGVQIMSPHYVLDPAQEKVVPSERWYLPPAVAPQDAGAAGKGAEKGQAAA